MALNQTVLQGIKKSYEDIHLYVKIYWILPATRWKSTTVITLVLEHAADIVLTERDYYQRVQSSMAGTDKMGEMLDNNSRFSCSPQQSKQTTIYSR